MKKLDIIYEDKYIIVVNKPSHMLTIGTNYEKEKTLYHEVLVYLQKKNKNNRIFIVHRLDKDTSGLVIFAKDKEIKEQLQGNWDKVKRIYMAVVEGKLQGSGTITSYLKENKALITYSTDDKVNGKLAITKYKTLKISKSYSLVEIEILTGRKNQIRVHMSDLKHPIMGDKKYGAKTNPLNKMALVATTLQLVHPKTKELLEFKIEIPKEFSKMFNLKEKWNMKVIFLDIDGVLNTLETFKRNTIIYKETGKRLIEIDEFRVKYLKEIIDKTSAKIVLSSSWRTFFKKENDKIIPSNQKGHKLLEILNKYNIEIYDLTPYDKERYRQNEIETYLNEHEVDEFIIIDDESYDLPKYIGKELIKTSTTLPYEMITNMNECLGLSEEHIEEAIKKLNNYNQHKYKLIKK